MFSFNQTLIGTFSIIQANTLRIASISTMVISALIIFLMVIEVYIVELLSYYMVEVHRYNEQDIIEDYINEV